MSVGGLTASADGAGVSSRLSRCARSFRPVASHRRRLPPAQRREQILAAATCAFAQDGYATTSLEDVARQAGVTRAIVYRHFASKADLYVTVLDRMLHRLAQATGAPHFTPSSIDGLLTAAAEDPDGFRRLFRHAAREPEFREHTEQLRSHVFGPDPTTIGSRVARVVAAIVDAARERDPSGET